MKAKLTGFGFFGSIDGESWPDYVTLDNGGDVLDGTYLTKDYMAAMDMEVVSCRVCAKRGTADCPMRTDADDGFCAWGERE